MSGKGSRPRPFSVSQSEFDRNYDQIFGKKCGCGRSPTGKCIGWHGLTEQEFQAKLAEYKQQKNH